MACQAGGGGERPGVCSDHGQRPSCRHAVPEPTGVWCAPRTALGRPTAQYTPGPEPLLSWANGGEGFRRAGHLSFARGIIVHFDAEAGPIEYDDVAPADDVAFLDPVAPEVQCIDPVKLLGEEVWDGGADVGGGHHANGRGHRVRRHGHVIAAGHIGDLAGPEQAAALLQIRRDDVGGAIFEDFAEAPAQVEVLAAAYGRAGAASSACAMEGRPAIPTIDSKPPFSRVLRLGRSIMVLDRCLQPRTIPGPPLCVHSYYFYCNRYHKFLEQFALWTHLTAADIHVHSRKSPGFGG
jgi:hypothetical protein